MSATSPIEWTDATWNPVTGCVKVSPGCKNCYAETFSERFRGVEGHHFERGFDVHLRPERLGEPLRWKKPRRVFVCSMSDLFQESVPDEFIDHVFTVMATATAHTFQVLTKRPERMREYASKRWAAGRGEVWKPLSNVWLGVSAEDQERADGRIPILLDTPAAVRFVSVEPMLGPIDMACATQPDAIPALDWVICGGESGHGARPMHPDWARALRDQCVEAGVPFFFKQWGEWAGAGGHPKNLPHAFVDYSGRVQRYNAQDPPPVPCYEPACMARPGKKAAGREIDGRTWDEMPEAAAV